jgi:hypothetical protein
MKREEIKSLRSEFPFLTENRIKFIAENSGKKSMRGIKNEMAKANAEFESAANQPDAKRIEVEVFWAKNRTWGMNPTAKCWVQYADGTWKEAEPEHASGWGYDKKSTVVAGVLNQMAIGMLYRRRRRAKSAPYGVRYCNSRDYLPYFEGGVGMSCYYDIAKFLGGKMEQVADAPNYDKFVFTF